MGGQVALRGDPSLDETFIGDVGSAMVFIFEHMQRRCRGDRSRVSRRVLADRGHEPSVRTDHWHSATCQQVLCRGRSGWPTRVRRPRP